MDTLTGYPDTLVANFLANDNIDTFLRYTASILSGPYVIGATAYLDSNNNLVYIPAAGVAATDTITYSVCDEFGACSIAQVYIHVFGELYNTGIVNVGDKLDINLYPNPASSVVNVSSSSAMQSISLIDVSGREVMKQSIKAHTTTLNIDAFSPGIYTVMIHTSDGVAAKRLVKE